ncbi:MAG: patatin-like phospholipase family protein [Pseudomonadota bacterium]
MKRILSLSGGGVRGVVEVAFLEAIEEIYQKRGYERLSDVFDLVGGTSTGALIAGAISLGKPISDIRKFYTEEAPKLFGKRRIWLLLTLPIFDTQALEKAIIDQVGEVTLGDPKLQTYLGIVSKRLDTGSPWILSNIPTAPYFEDDPSQGFIGNKHYRLSKLLRASSAAPTLFQQETLEIAPNEPPGVFVDGGASPFNDPSVALFMLARMKAFGLQWPLGVDNLSVLSIGTGRYRRQVKPQVAARFLQFRVAYETLRGMISDAEGHALTLMQWMGHSDAPASINSEINDLEGDNLFGDPAFRFQRLDLPIDKEKLADVGVKVSDADIQRFYSIDDPGIIGDLLDVSREYCKKAYDLEKLLP